MWPASSDAHPRFSLLRLTFVPFPPSVFASGQRHPPPIRPEGSQATNHPPTRTTTDPPPFASVAVLTTGDPPAGVTVTS